MVSETRLEHQRDECVFQAKYLAQIIVLGAQVVGRAFTRALKQEYAASQAAAGRRTSTENKSQSAANDVKLGISLDEAIQILNVDRKLDKEEVQKKFEHLFNINEKSKGGSFYLQSKTTINRAFVDQMRQMTTYSNGFNHDYFRNAIKEENIRKCIDTLNKFPAFKLRMASKTSTQSKAAVLVPFCVSNTNEPSIIVTLRSAKLLNHKWMISFPGGKESEEDGGDACKTAVRETVEEIGLDASAIKVIGTLNPVITSQRDSLVSTVLAIIDSEQLLKSREWEVNTHEVEKVFCIPLRKLCDEKHWRYTHWRNGWVTPVYIDDVCNGRDAPKIWGLTATLIYACLSALLPEAFKVSIPFRMPVLK
ncbi:DnaJ domain and NUDIX domain hydrolase-like protein [Dinothrombium tinctorium]|uniref:DnaJ domain and NUDIX domain hydrolase-like protein n=1 Tax=Dinothrombium tinctorium TaxID=1965070 RepID=A0A3S3NNX9_9ACAR|nr:DnaJ domain and NUDIX domain hydrolase-like protein [Dinothrombium tinctorium]RWS09933.1 DnaJ domain and NUDIX domain hydrolase-like protein [Dinothrombium tinctorium]RWS09962.1 DnaJ domain and NUDIX domain hydrolase-like protein [Dinothrombium tinctorium]